MRAVAWPEPVLPIAFARPLLTLLASRRQPRQRPAVIPGALP